MTSLAPSYQNPTINKIIKPDPDFDVGFIVIPESLREVKKGFLEYRKWFRQKYPTLNYEHARQLMRTSPHSQRFLSFLEGRPSFNTNVYFMDLLTKKELSLHTIIGQKVLEDFLDQLFKCKFPLDTTPDSKWSAFNQFKGWLLSGGLTFPAEHHIDQFMNFLEFADEHVNHIFWVIKKYYNSPSPTGPRGRTKVLSHCKWKKKTRWRKEHQG